MKKRLILISILFMLLSTTLFAPIILAKEIKSRSTFIGLFNSEISFNNENEDLGLIAPGSSKTVEFEVKYKLSMGNFAKWFFTKRRIGRLILFGLPYIIKLKALPTAVVNLSVECEDSYCSAKLEPETVEFAFNNVFQVSDKVKLVVTVDENAPALTESKIEIRADFPGLWTIKPVDNSTSVSFLPEYVSNLAVESEIEHTIPPLKNYTIPINITNNGNGESKVNISIIDSDNWTISLDTDEFTLKPDGKTEQILLTVTEPPKNFKDKSINLVFTPTCTQEVEDTTYQQGEPVQLTFTFYNDGSLKEEGNGINLAYIAVIVIVIIILLLVIFFFLKRRQ